MKDDYPRATWTPSTGPEMWWTSDSQGALKVVPADAIVIERSGSWIDVHHAQTFVANAMGFYSTRPEFTSSLLDRARAHAAHLIEAAEYLDENPQVDEAQIEALSCLLDETQFRAGSGFIPGRRRLARALLATGRIEVKP
jgi:hypothetical protein